MQLHRKTKIAAAITVALFVGMVGLTAGILVTGTDDLVPFLVQGGLISAMQISTAVTVVFYLRQPLFELDADRATKRRINGR